MEMDKTKTYISIREYIACFINLCKVGLFIFIFLDSIVGGWDLNLGYLGCLH